MISRSPLKLVKHGVSLLEDRILNKWIIGDKVYITIGETNQLFYGIVEQVGPGEDQCVVRYLERMLGVLDWTEPEIKKVNNIDRLLYF